MTDITKKQYLLSSCRIENLSMTEHRIGEYYLYTDRQLNTAVCKTADGKDVFLLGNAFCMDEDGKSVLEDIGHSTESQLEQATRCWTGKWTVVTASELFTDACGLIPAFYINKDGNFYVSSSLALISRELGTQSDLCVNDQGLTWHFLPDTIIQGVRGLICTEKLKLRETHVETEFCNWISDNASLSTQEKCAKVAELLVNGVKNIGVFSGRKMLLALTGGKDSRVTFCALLKSGVSFSTYTAEHDNISSSDKIIPVKLAKHFGIEHKYIKKGKFSAEKLKDYKNFIAGNSNGADAVFYACGQFDQISSDAVVIRSGLYEAGQTYSRGLCDNSVEGMQNGIIRYYSELQKQGAQRTAFDKWIEYVKHNTVDGIDIRDRLYIEQRVGAWASAIEQSLDINDFLSIQIANCAELMSVLLSCNDKERKELALSYETMRLLEPQVLEYDVNKPAFMDKVLRAKQIAKNPLVKARKFLNRVHRR